LLIKSIFINTMKLSFRQLKNVIRRSINEALLQEAEEQLLLEPDIPPEDEEDQDEVSAGGVAGYALPLGASPPGYSRKRFVRSARASFGGVENE
jgi:hypothetical protein